MRAHCAPVLPCSCAPVLHGGLKGGEALLPMHIFNLCVETNFLISGTYNRRHMAFSLIEEVSDKLMPPRLDAH